MIDARKKKLEEFQKSQVLPSSQHQVETAGAKIKDFADGGNVDKRKMLRNYSDLFGITQYEQASKQYLLIIINL